MGLASALTTALTGLTAAETQIDVVGNNLANSQTVGFKESKAIFATQFLQTLGLGSSPTGSSGGTNPRQTGLGTQVAQISPNFKQGTVEISSNPSDLAIQGDGFFIVQGASGEQLYTRNGIFDTNSQNELVTITGNRVLGYGVDEFYQIQTTQLVPLSIPLGSQAVAQATQNVFLEGIFSSTGDLADTAEVIQSAILGDGAVPRPTTAGIGIAVATTPSIASSTQSLTQQPDIGAAGTAVSQVETLGGSGTHTAGATFQYRVTYGTAGGSNETLASNAISGTVLGADADPNNNGIQLDNLPTSSSFGTMNIYRTTDGGSSFFLLESVPMASTYVDDNGTALSATALNPALVNAAGAGGTHTGGQVFQYRFTFVDNSGTETAPSSPITVTVPGGASEDVAKSIILNSLPQDADYESINIYRTAAGGSNFFQLDNVTMGTTSYVDNNGTTLSSTALNDDTISGNYTYMISYYRSGVGESRPTPLSVPVNVVGGRVHITDLPTPPVSDGTFPQYDQIRLYRNLAGDSNNFYLVDTLNPGDDYTDLKADADISDLNISGNQLLDQDGPKVATNTLLINVLRRDGNTYENMYTEGTMTFAARKGGRSMEDKTFEITDSTTVQDLINFMEDSMGIQTANDDSQNPIPGSVNNIVGETGSLNPGGTVQNGRIRFVSNNGADNALAVGLSAFQLTSETGVVTTPNLSFGKIQTAAGQSAVTDFIVYDSLGSPLNVRVTAVLESRNGSATTYRWYGESADNDPISGSDISVGTGLVSFDGEGNMISVSNATISIDRRNSPAISPLEFDLDFSQISGLAAAKSQLAASRQDGSSPGVLSSFIIGEDGVISGVFSNGISRDLGQLRLARFANPGGLEQRGQNMFSAGVNSGLPVQGNPGEQGIGSIKAGAVELSNTDIGRNLIDLVLATTQYRGNTRVITAAQQLFDELLNLRR